MSIDDATTHNHGRLPHVPHHDPVLTSTDEHAHHDYHHEDPEVVDSRQRLGVWLFIGGDIVILSALLFTYLYLRGVNTDGHWMSMLGYQGHSYAWYENALSSAAGLPAPTLIHVSPMSPGLNWLVALAVVVSAAVIWSAERGLRAMKNARAYSNMALLATLVAVLAVILSIVQLRHIPQIFVANNDSQVMTHTAYSSAMMVIIAVALVHYVVLAFLGLGLTIRSARGVINGENWYQARLVRLFWVWVAVGAVVTTLLTTTVNKI
jgi:heme/copper-type cytochrome/quinol oxidase subunit 3